MKNKLTSTILILVLTINLFPLGSVFAREITTVKKVELNPDDLEFGLVDNESLWLKTGNNLYYTKDTGETWSDISPATRMIEPYLVVSFPGPEQGFALYLTQTDTELDLELYQSTSQGEAWSAVVGDLQENIRKQFLYPIGAIQMQWLNNKQAFVLVKESTSSNFSQGLLFFTDDGGKHWQSLDIPAAEAFVFTNREVGYILNPADSKTLYRSLDGGESWSLFEVQLPEAPTWEMTRLGLPVITDDLQVFLPLDMTEDGINEHKFLALLPENRKPGLQAELNLADVQDIQVEESENPLLPAVDHYINEIQTQDGKDFWVSLSSGECQSISSDENDDQITCHSTWQILRSDGEGSDWVNVTLPDGKDLASKQFSTQSSFSQIDLNSDIQASEWVQIYQGHAFDACEIPTLAQLNTWYSKSPYRAVNAYIGGISRLCANTPLSSTYFRNMYQQGWRFILTWVGHQSSCSGLRYPFPDDVNQAYQYGVDNANLARARLQQYSLSNPDGSGAIVYLDLEYFTYSTKCSNAARAYVNGWTTRLSQLGIRSGLYTTSYILKENKFHAISKPPSAVWIAEWYSPPGYRPNQTVWNLNHLSNDLWVSNQRILQYTKTHSQTWGGVSLSIDSDVSNGPVSVPYGTYDSLKNRLWLPIVRKH